MIGRNAVSAAFDLDFNSPRHSARKPPSEYKLVGTRVRRVDMPAKAAGTYTHMQHVRVADMLHGRVVRPRGQRAYGTRAAPRAVDESSIKDIPTAKVVWDKAFLGVVADKEWDAIKAARQLKVESSQVAPPFPNQAALYDHIRQAPTRPKSPAAYSRTLSEIWGRAQPTAWT